MTSADRRAVACDRTVYPHLVLGGDYWFASDPVAHHRDQNQRRKQNDGIEFDLERRYGMHDNLEKCCTKVNCLKKHQTDRKHYSQ